MATYKSNYRRLKRNENAVLEGKQPRKSDSRNKKIDKMNNILKNKQKGYK